MNEINSTRSGKDHSGGSDPYFCASNKRPLTVSLAP